MAAFLCSVRPKKDKPNRTQFTVGSDRINYPGLRQKPRRRAFLHVQQCRNPPQQWRHPQHRPHHQTQHDVSHGSRTRCTIHYGTRGGVYENNIGGNGTQATSHPHTNRQCNGGSSHQHKNNTQAIKSNGHALPLAERQRMSTPIQILLATWQTQSCGLLDKTPFCCSPCQC